MKSFENFLALDEAQINSIKARNPELVTRQQGERGDVRANGGGAFGNGGGTALPSQIIPKHRRLVS